MRRIAALIPMLAVLGLALALGCAKKLTLPPPPAGLRILSPAPGDTLPGLTASLRFELANVILEAPTGVAHEGRVHLDVSVDGAAAVHVATDTVTLHFAADGPHALVVELKRGDETRLDPTVRLERTIVLSVAPARPTLHIIVPAPGDTVRSGDVRVKLDVHNFVLDPPATPPLPGHGRIHVRMTGSQLGAVVDRLVSADSLVFLGDQSFKGIVRIHAELVTSLGMPLPQPVEDSVTFVFQPGISLRRDVQPILSDNCGVPFCHSGVNPILGENLSTPELTLSTAVNVQSAQSSKKRIAPGDAEASYTVDKIKGINLGGSNRMPLGNNPLTEAEIQMIVDWINEGARDN